MRQEIDLLQFPRLERELGRRTDEHRAIARRFDKEFFDGGRDTGYGGYRYDGRWRAVALRMMLHYGLWCPSRVLDVGCAKGFLVADFNTLKLYARGIDISAYAVNFGGYDCMVADARELPFVDKTQDLVVSINTIHNLDRAGCIQALREIERVGKAAYVTVDAWRTEEDRERMFAWNLTAKTILHVEEWKLLFQEAGYTGDYFWWMP